MHRGQPIRRLPVHRQDLRPRPRLFLPPSEVAAGDELDRHEHLPAVHPNVEHLGHVRVADLRHGLRLALQPGRPGPLAPGVPQQLDRHAPVQPGIPGREHPAHRPRAQQPFDRMIRSSEWHAFEQKSWHLRWREMMSGDFNVSVIDSTHATLLHEPQVSQLAELFSSSLDAVEE